jgi:hypothetical protein
MTRTQDRPVPVASYDIRQNDLGGTEITVNVTAGSHAAFTLVLLSEKRDRVEVTVRERVTSGVSTMDVTLYRFTMDAQTATWVPTSRGLLHSKRDSPGQPSCHHRRSGGTGKLSRRTVLCLR